MASENNENDFKARLTIECRPPVKEITLAVSLLVMGSLGILLGLLMLSTQTGRTRIHGVLLTLLAMVFFIPGFYYTRIAWYAYRGYKGFSFSSIPAV
ncbi:hypothetical protein SUGI_1036540 [Cryptomeria japonica]|uniref:uncharacterized protein LOC131079986 n=1 Tax=Cryptomeria japonica TaxID=3369 RepID=UPI0024149542|nr:uncharacterized protein LOC131079986 [Cryptomeria japonica]GLJ49136.1 hypothetical protein SUGI_1036540 [Cryptomeria japonica]